MHFVKALLVVPSLLAGVSARLQGRGSKPNLSYDPNTTKLCSWWFDNKSGISCQTILSDNYITLAQFRGWNPSVGEDCNELKPGFSYCVEGPAVEPPSSSSSSTPPKTTEKSTSTTSTSSVPTTTRPSNGIKTPQPTQPGMVENCNKFHYIYKGNYCGQITSYNGISQEDFARWNPQIGQDCSGMLADHYACVGITGAPTPTTSTAAHPSNGITTPTPTQPSMVDNCNKFHYIYKGNTCGQITSYHQISQEDFAKWNPQVGQNCGGLWADHYACVGVITPTRPGNGIATPMPTQPDMVGNCNKFHYIYKGNTCDQITSYNHISQEDFARWNPKIGGDCKGMWADTYACVGVI